jgi:Cu(I)/Ag(I) efflux system membrane protein CusA/SilA
VATEWPGQSPDLVEDQVTYPLSAALLSAPQVRYVRGQSFFGLSLVYVIFEDGTDLYWGRSRVLEFLDEAKGSLPESVSPRLGPDATGVGWVYEYALIDTTGNLDLQELRALQDWNLRYALESVPGVAEVASVGGFVKQYQVLVDPDRLRAFGIPLRDVVEAVRASNEDVGGRLLEVSGHEIMIRGRGYVKSKADLELAPLRAVDGTPVFVRDVATVQLGPQMRRGVAELNGLGEAVGGIVVMRYGENALRVIEGVKERLAEVRESLPPGVEIVTTYDRSELIEASIDTLRHTLVEEMVVVALIILLFLFSVRSALIPILTLPLAVILAFIPLALQNLTINIMSLGGIAVAIGAMVDASIIIVENIHKRLEAWQEEGEPGSRTGVIISAMQEVGPSIFFSLLVMTVAFMPVFTLQATEGRLFRPLAFTKTYAMGFAALLAVTVTPALAVLVLRGRVRPESSHPLSRWMIRAYAPVVRFVVRRRALVVLGAALLVAVTVPVFLSLENEFMPPLNEGVILYMPTAPPGMSVAEAARVLQIMDRELSAFPEVQSVFGKAGRAETATDPAPLSMVETVIVLRPRDEWRKGMTWDGLIAEMDQHLRIPGMPNLWWMPIQTRTEMLATGIRSQLGIKVFGDDLDQILTAGLLVEKALTELPGTRSVYAERITGGLYLDAVVDREEAARHGLSVADVNEVIATAIGGADVSETVEGRERYPIQVRYAREFRDHPEALETTLVATPSGAQIPLSQITEMEFVRGPDMIRSEDGRLVGFVFVDVEGRSVPDYVGEARRRVAETVRLPEGVRLEWAGQFTYYERARERLKLILPLTLFLVVLLLYLNNRSMAKTAIVLLAVPFSLVGAVWLLHLLDYRMSVAVWVGIIALAGLDAETGVVMLLYLSLAYERAKKAGRMRSFEDLRESIVEGAAHRVRPKLMTVLTTMIALLPILWSSGTGADVMKRIAAPMVGGLVTSFILELTVYPAIFAWWKGRKLPSAPEQG